MVSATGNSTLTSLLEGISSRTVRARVWRGLVESNAADRTIAEHEAIYAALAARDPAVAEAAALLHVNTTEQWLRSHVERHESAGDPWQDGRREPISAPISG